MKLGGITLFFALFVVVGIVVAAVDSFDSTVSQPPVVANVQESLEPTTEAMFESSPEGQVEGTTAQADQVKVTRVIDGDTFEIEGSKTIRMITTDTPETAHPSKPVECIGKEASNKTKELIEGRNVKLEKDVSETDRYGRLLRYVYLEDGRMLNEVLIQEGFANAVSYPPDVKYLDRLRAAEASAKSNKWGLWSGACDTAKTTTQSTPAITKPSPSKATPASTRAATLSGCGGNSYNCSDFSTCAEAKAVFNSCSYDVNELDRDQDGIPCDTLCQ